MKKKYLLVGAIILSLMDYSYAGLDWVIRDDTTIESGEFQLVEIYDSLDSPPKQSAVLMTGGTISTLTVYDTSIFTLNGGRVDTMFLMDTSSSNLRNGEIGMIYPNGHTVNIYGLDFLVADLGSSFLVSGSWENGSPFEIRFVRAEPTDENISFHEIPEPASSILFAFSGIVLLRRRT